MARPKGIPAWNKGLKRLYPAWNKGKKLSDAHVQRLREAHMGQVPSNKGVIGKRKYGCEWSEPKAYQQRLERRAGREKPELCELCDRDGKIVFDHCHKTGKFRGWICYRCNNALGSVSDQISILMKMIEYLKKNNHSL